uniref:V-SNARE domain-containing protein n=1 Tax=Panagrellus redivivus TaxID=6233 RepID=A0A7E4ZUM8_PANRE
MVEDLQVECVDKTEQINKLVRQLSTLPSANSISFDFSNPNSAGDARIHLLRVKEQLAAYGKQVEDSIHEAEQLCNDGADALSPEQFHALKEAQFQLRSTYKQLTSHTDAILARSVILFFLLLPLLLILLEILFRGNDEDDPLF